VSDLSYLIVWSVEPTGEEEAPAGTHIQLELHSEMELAAVSQVDLSIPSGERGQRCLNSQLGLVQQDKGGRQCREEHGSDDEAAPWIPRVPVNTVVLNTMPLRTEGGRRAAGRGHILYYG